MASSTAPQTVTPELVDSRARRDRRKQPTPMFSRYAFFGGRRAAHRRGAEQGQGFVDVHGHGLFAVVTGLAALNILDAFFTILFLSYGGEELNPIVQLSLDMGMWSFIALKSVGIGICAVFLVVTKNYLVSRIGLAFVFVGYTALLGWHAYLYTRLPEHVI